MNILLQKYKQAKGLLFYLYLEIARKFRILINKPIYHVIGDSHATNFLHPAFIIHHVGPATAYKLNFKNSTTRGREKVLKILNKIYKQKKLNVIFVFGELDVRLQINKVSKQKKISVNRVVSATVESYFEFLKYIKKQFPLVNIYVFNVLPQGEEANIYNFPHYADRDKRSSIAMLMNTRYKEYSEKENYKFIGIYNKLINASGHRKKEYVFDDVHFNRKIIKFVVEELK
jgi:lysophospholipase L1-like esterase